MCQAQVNSLSVHHHAQTIGLGVAHCGEDGGVRDVVRRGNTLLRVAEVK
jgi:hypothetical protein